MTIAFDSPGALLMRRLDDFSCHTDDSGALTRLFLSPAHRSAVDQLMGWMREAKLSPWLDAIGNVRARYEGATAGAPALMIASHIDTVRDAGCYDGALGVLAAVGVVQELSRAGTRLPFAIEIVAFGDEEGVRFPVTLSGSRALAGRFDAARLDDRDGDDICMSAALKNFGCDPESVASLAFAPGDLVGYVEMHIEQGPVLEAEDLPVGVVTGISGCSRYRVELTGEAGHAGTVPMTLRRDALTAAAEMVLAIESRGRSAIDSVATVGRLDLKPGAVNVVPGKVSFTIDIRAPEDCIRQRICSEILAEISMIAEQRRVTAQVTPMHDAPACRCDETIMDRLSNAIARAGHAVRRLPSGAGHDAMSFAGHCPIGMLFVRCERGISHNPAEAITLADAETAMAVLLDFVMHFRAPE